VTGSGFTRLTNNWASKNLKNDLRIGFFAHHVERGSGFRHSDLQADARQKDERDVEQIDLKTPEELQLFTGTKFVPASFEISVSHGSHSRKRGIAWHHVAGVTIPVGVREMCGSRIGTLGQESLEIRTIIIVLARLRDCCAMENVCKLTEE